MEREVRDSQVWQVCCAAVHYFEAEQALDGAGQPREHQRGGAMVINPRRQAQMGQLITLSASEARRLLALESIQVPDSKPLPGGPGSVPRATPFGIPVSGATAFDGHNLGDPRPPAEVVGVPQPVPATAPVAKQEPEETLDLDTADAEEIARWISGEKPEPWTEDVIVDAAGDDATMAAKLLEAEEIATKGNPRKGVSKRLAAIAEKE